MCVAERERDDRSAQQASVRLAPIKSPPCTKTIFCSPEVVSGYFTVTVARHCYTGVLSLGWDNYVPGGSLIV